jgi:4-amino-4-deoxy-L-arabinose transferase-like glycosyltransferase
MGIKFVAALFILSIVLNLFSFSFSPIKWWDETVYANLGHQLLNNPFDYSFHGWADRVSVWEGKAGFRPPLLPYIIAVIDYVSNSSQLLVNLFIPFFAAFGVVGLYFLARNIFDENIAVYSSSILAVLPIYVVHSGKILTDVLATVLVIFSFLAFWIGFKKNNRKMKLLTGFLVGLAVLAKYTSLIIVPAFFLYIFIRKRNLSFLKDRYLYFAIVIFIATLSPLLAYGYFVYGNPVGPFIHGWIGGSFSGGIQPWYFFFTNSFMMFSVASFAAMIGIVSVVKLWKKPNVLLIFCWFFVFLLFFSSLVHKDVRFFLPMAPSVCILAGVGINYFKKWRNLAFAAVFMLTLISTILFVSADRVFYDSKPVYCFFQSINFLKSTENDSFVFTENSPLVYYYAHKENYYYTFVNGTIKNLDETVRNDYSNRTVYVLWTLYANPADIRPVLASDKNFTKVFSCPEDGSLAQIYKSNIKE